MRNLQRVFSVILVITLLLAITGCGQSTQSKDAGTKATETASKEPIKIGTWGPLSGSGASMGVDAKNGLIAYINKVNDEGGINGRKIEVVSYDDEYQPAKALASAKRAVEQDKIIAAVGTMGTAGNVAVMPYLMEKKVPLIGPYALATKLQQPPKRYIFTTLPGYTAAYHIVGNFITNNLQGQGKKIGFLYMDNDAGHEAAEGLKSYLKENNLPPLASDITYTAGTTDFSSQVLKLKQDGAEVIATINTTQDAALVLKEAFKISYKPTWIFSSGAGTKQLFSLLGNDAAAEGAIVAAQNPANNETSAGLTEFKDAMKKYFPEHQIGPFSYNSWAAAKLTVEAMKRAGDNLTSESIVDSLETIKDFDTGVYGPMTYEPNQHAAGQYTKFLVAKNGNWEKQTDWLAAK